MKGKGRSRQAILAAVTVLAAAQAGTAYASTGPASESGVQTGAWIQEGQDWKYQGTDGTLKTGWVKTESGWYYLDPQTGRMMTGWITVDGRRYYMNTPADGVEGQMRPFPSIFCRSGGADGISGETQTSGTKNSISAVRQYAAGISGY